MTIYEFADLYGLNLQIEKINYRKYSCKFEDCEIKNDGILISDRGVWFTPEKAVEDYVYKIRGKILVYKAMSSSERLDIDIPKDLIAYWGTCNVENLNCPRCNTTLIDKISDALNVSIKKCPSCGYCE